MCSDMFYRSAHLSKLSFASLKKTILRSCEGFEFHLVDLPVQFSNLFLMDLRRLADLVI